MSCRHSSEDVTLMADRPPRIAPDTHIGPDVDLDRDSIRLADGTRLTQVIVDSIVEETRRPSGRPSLSGAKAPSPQVTFRVSPELRAKAAAEAARQGRRISDVAREALERYLAS
jgi:predicted HicB family RNase H-like nuclease